MPSNGFGRVACCASTLRWARWSSVFWGRHFYLMTPGLSSLPAAHTGRQQMPEDIAGTAVSAPSLQGRGLP